MDLKLNIIVYNVGGLLRGIQTVTKKKSSCIADVWYNLTKGVVGKGTDWPK